MVITETFEFFKYMYSKLSNIDLIMGILFVSEILTCLFCIQLEFHMKLIANYTPHIELEI